MTIARAHLLVVTTLLVTAIWGCSGGDEASSGSAAQSEEQDRQEIAATLAEAAERWHYGDKAVLYDMEFDHVTEEYTYDAYLEIKKMSGMNSDTLEAFNVKDVQFFGRDSADVEVEVVFVGPVGDTSKLAQIWRMYRHHDKWIRPTMSSHMMQMIREEERRVADSAANAETNDDW